MKISRLFKELANEFENAPFVTKEVFRLHEWHPISDHPKIADFEPAKVVLAWCGNHCCVMNASEFQKSEYYGNITHWKRITPP